MTQIYSFLSRFMHRALISVPCSFVLGSLLLSSPAAMAADNGQPLNGWRTGVMSQADGSFAYCVTEAEFKNGLWLIFALNPQGEVNVGLGDRNAHLPVGISRDIALSVDGKTYTLPGQVAKPQLLVMNASAHPNLYSMLAKGNKLNVDGDTFSLHGSANALGQLKECVLTSSGTNSLPKVAQAAPVAPKAVERTANNTAPPSSPPASDVVSAAIPAKTSSTMASVSTPQQQAQTSRNTAVDAIPNIQFDAAMVTQPGERGVAPPPDFATAVDHSVAQQQAQTPQKIANDNDPSKNETTLASQQIAPTSSQASPTTKRTSAGFVMSSSPTKDAQENIPQKQTQKQTQPARVASSSSSSTTTISTQKKALPEPLMNLLHRIDLDNVKAIAPDTQTGEVYAWEGKSGFAFLSESLRGAVREAAVPSGGQLDLMARRHLEYLSSICRSGNFSFKMGQVERRGALSVATAGTRCRVEDNEFYSRQVFTLTVSGGKSDVLSVVTHTQRNGYDAATRVQKDLVNVLLGRQ